MGTVFSKINTIQYRNNKYKTTRLYVHVGVEFYSTLSSVQSTYGWNWPGPSWRKVAHPWPRQTTYTAIIIYVYLSSVLNSETRWISSLVITAQSSYPDNSPKCIPVLGVKEQTTKIMGLNEGDGLEQNIT